MIQDPIFIIADHWQILLSVLLITTTGYAFILCALKMIFKDQLTPSEYFSLGLAGWLLPASILAFLSFFMRSEITSRLIPILLPILCLLSIIFLLRLKPDLKPALQPIDFFLPLFFAITIPLRLIFVKNLVLPSYFDSVEHYAIIQNILNPESTSPFISQTYYHIGYHILTAFAITISKAPIGATMLILGQCLLAIMPLAVFFLIRYTTKSDSAGLLAVILSAFGWYMPAHAVDWGKYPALMSLGLIPFVTSVAYLYANQQDLKKSQSLVLVGIILASISISTLIHSRSLVIYLLIFIAWLIASQIEKLRSLAKIIVLGLVFLGIVLEIILLQMQPLLAVLFDPYLNAGIVITSLVLFLSLFAWRTTPQLATTSLLIIAFLCGSIFIPVKGLGGYPDLTLLDRPFAEMILYLPLTILGGLGLAGLQNITINRFAFNKWIGFVLIGVVAIHAFKTYKLQPSDCCVIIGNDDVAAIAWMNIHTPHDARIGVAATGMDVLPSAAFEGFSGSDAGVWIAPLINRVTIPLFNDTSFDQPSALESICSAGIRYLYVGEKGVSFNWDLLNSHPEWYAIQLSMPAVQVYEVTGCNH